MKMNLSILRISMRLELHIILQIHKNEPKLIFFYIGIKVSTECRRDLHIRKKYLGTLWDAMMISLRPKLGFASKSGAHDPATFKDNDAKFESVLNFMENHLARFSI